jgi:hypothetical protein
VRDVFEAIRALELIRACCGRPGQVEEPLSCSKLLVDQSGQLVKFVNSVTSQEMFPLNVASDGDRLG